MELDGLSSKRALPQSTSMIPGMSGYADFSHLQNGDNNPTKFEGEEEDRKKEHRKRSKNWTRVETLKLIGVRREFDGRFRKSGRKAELWEEIARVLQGPDFLRDGQQCKDKWEKLTAGYKEVMDGVREREDYPYYEELHDFLSCKAKASFCSAWECRPRGGLQSRVEAFDNRDLQIECKKSPEDGPASLNKRKRSEETVPSMDLSIVQKLLETIIARQQLFFKDMLAAIERKELVLEQMRQQREEKWRSEDRAQRFVFHNTMLVLIQRLVGERPPVSRGMSMASEHLHSAPSPSDNDFAYPKKRSKNWKRSEVMHLIRFRRDMDDRFIKSTRRAALWDEVGEKLASLGIIRDGKQCREKWDKLVAEYKEVMEGRKEKEESSYFAELATFLGRARPAEIKHMQEHEGHPES